MLGFFPFLKKGVFDTTRMRIDSLTEHNAEYQGQHMRKYEVFDLIIADIESNEH